MSVKKWTQCPTSRMNNNPPPPMSGKGSLFIQLWDHMKEVHWQLKLKQMYHVRPFPPSIFFQSLSPERSRPSPKVPASQGEDGTEKQFSKLFQWDYNDYTLMGLHIDPEMTLKSLQGHKNGPLALWKSSMDSWSLASNTTTWRTYGLYNLILTFTNLIQFVDGRKLQMHRALHRQFPSDKKACKTSSTTGVQLDTSKKRLQDALRVISQPG